MKILLIFSGGMDSTTALHKLRFDGDDVSCLSFDYGQKHSKELEFASYWTDKLGISHRIISLDGIFSGSALLGDRVMPTTDYSVESMKSTVVPNRNMVMISIAISIAISEGFDAIAYGAHAGDSAVYPDCREEFVAAMRTAALLSDWKKIEILTPLISLTKEGVYRLAMLLGVDISRTWSCYMGGDEPCGQCGSCRARIEAIR